MTDDLTSLASAYLDGEATSDEIAQVEGDAATLAEVERLRQVRAVVGDVDPVAISAREAHLAAALDAWDRLPASERNGAQIGAAAGVDPVAAAGVSSITSPAASTRGRRTSRSNVWILAGAASLVVLLVGGLTLRSLTGDDEPDTAVETESGSADTATAATSAAGGDAATTDPSVEPSEDIADTDTETDVAGEGAPPPEEDLEELDDPDDLTVYASDAVDDDGEVIEQADPPVVEDAAPRDVDEPAEPSSDAPESGPADFPLCAGADVVVGPAMYQEMFVVIGIDVDRNLAVAYLPDTCELVAQAPLP